MDEKKRVLFARFFCSIPMITIIIYILFLDFDPTKLNMAQLRNILSVYDIDYTQARKKAELVALFRENIASKSKQLLKKQERLAPYVGDIEDATLKRKTKDSVSIYNCFPFYAFAYFIAISCGLITISIIFP